MKIKDIDSEIERYDQAMYKFDILKKSGSDKFDETLYRKVFQTKIVKKAEKAKYEERGRYLYSLIRESEKAVVKVDKNIYPGSRVFMGDKTASFAPSSAPLVTLSILPVSAAYTTPISIIHPHK